MKPLHSVFAFVAACAALLSATPAGADPVVRLVCRGNDLDGPTRREVTIDYGQNKGWMATTGVNGDWELPNLQITDRKITWYYPVNQQTITIDRVTGEFFSISVGGNASFTLHCDPEQDAKPRF